MAEKLIVDTDIGYYYDDAFAILLATRSPELELLGVTTVYGDTKLRARIARKLLDIAGRHDVPVAAGIGLPLQGREHRTYWFEGANILDGSEAEDGAIKEHAVDFIIRTIMENPGEVTIAMLGALTNLAVALRLEPRIADHVKQVILMGGVLVPVVDPKGIRRSPIEENNFNADALAAQIVCGTSMPMTLCPIDVTLQVALRQDQLDAIHASTDGVARVVSSLLDAWPSQETEFNLSMGIPSEHTGFWLHDPLTVGIAFDRSFCGIARLHIATEFAPTIVERDMLLRTDILRTIPRKLEPNMDVCVTVDAKRFTDLFTARITGSSTPIG